MEKPVGFLSWHCELRVFSHEHTYLEYYKKRAFLLLSAGLDMPSYTSSSQDFAIKQPGTFTPPGRRVNLARRGEGGIKQSAILSSRLSQESRERSPPPNFFNLSLIRPPGRPRRKPHVIITIIGNHSLVLPSQT